MEADRRTQPVVAAIDPASDDVAAAALGLMLARLMSTSLLLAAAFPARERLDVLEAVDRLAVVADQPGSGERSHSRRHDATVTASSARVSRPGRPSSRASASSTAGSETSRPSRQNAR